MRREKSLSMIFQPKVPDQEAERNDADWSVDYLCGKAKEHTLSDMLFDWWTIRDMYASHPYCSTTQMLRISVPVFTFFAKNDNQSFFIRKNPLRVLVPDVSYKKQKKTPVKVSFLFGGPSGTRTPDRPVMSRLL